MFEARLAWAIEHKMDVVNLSLSTRSRALVEMFYELVDAAAFGSVMLVSAVNNVPAPSYPSQFAGVFSVAACPSRDPERFVSRGGTTPLRAALGHHTRRVRTAG